MKTIAEVRLDIQLLIAEVHRRLGRRHLTPRERLVVAAAVQRRAFAHLNFWRWIWFSEGSGIRLAPLLAYQLHGEIERSATALTRLL